MKNKASKRIFFSIIFLTIISIAVTQSSFYRRISQSQRLFNQIYNQIFSTYLHELNPEEFTEATINSLTSNLDPYTAYMVEEEKHQMDILSKGKYGGVGIQLSYRNEEMIVIAPMDGGPAQQNGILSGDIILKIDDYLPIKKVFGENIPKISSTKSLTGHSLGATGVHEAIYCLLMMNNNFLSGSANINSLDNKANNHNIHLETEQNENIENILSNSFGFGGTNATLLMSRYND